MSLSRSRSIQSENVGGGEDEDAVFSRRETGGKKNRINPSGPLDPTEFNLVESRERLLSDNQGFPTNGSILGTPNAGRQRRISTMRKRTGSNKAKPLSERSVSEMSFESTATTRGLKPVYREIKLKEMMKYYTPKWMAVVGICASVVSAF